MSCPNQLKSILSIIKCKLSFLILRTSLMCVRGSRSFTTHSGNHTVNDFEIAFDYTLGGDLLVWWDLKGRVCFESSLKKILGRVSIVPDLILLYCFFHENSFRTKRTFFNSVFGQFLVPNCLHEIPQNETQRGCYFALFKCCGIRQIVVVVIFIYSWIGHK